MIIHDIEQGTDEWLLLRAGMPTASNFSKLITSKGEPSKSMDDYAKTLAGATFAGKDLDPWEGNKWTERGTELEDDARRLYSFRDDVEIDQIGFVTNDDKRYGCSPDGLVGEDGLIEIKCLKAENHIKVILDYKKNGKCPTTYIQQVQGQMFITNRQWCDVVFYHPELPLQVIRQTIDEKIINGLKEQIEAVTIERDRIVGILRGL